MKRTRTQIRADRRFEEAVKAAQASYSDHAGPEYGLSDGDMARAIKAALAVLNTGGQSDGV